MMHFRKADYASALALELRNNEEGETFIRAKLTNGTAGFEPVHLFGHRGDIALNELLYRLDVRVFCFFY
jgi:lysosomal acid phosphatase